MSGKIDVQDGMSDCQHERDKLRSEVERLTALSELRGKTVADLADELGIVKAARDKLRAELDAVRAEHRRLQRVILENSGVFTPAQIANILANRTGR
jgi:hypothetical protein